MKEKTFDEILTEFAKRDSAGFVVWGQKLDEAHKREIAAKDAEIAELRECLREAVYNECNYCRTVRKDGTYGKCEHLRIDGGCEHLCGVNKWRKALKGASDED